MHFYKKFSSTIVRNNLLLLLFALFVGCSHVNDDMIRGRRAINATLDTVEREMDDNPVYADSLVNLIDSRSIRNKEQRARYALLYTAAEYKNYQPLTSDSLIMEAVRHYSISSNLDYRFLSYYYLGCAYLDMEQMPDASVAFAQAEQLVNEIDNDYWKGLLYSQLGLVFNESCDYNRSIEYFTMAETCFGKAEKERHRMYALFHIGCCQISKLDFNKADSVLSLVENEAIIIGDNDLLYDCLYRKIWSYLYTDKIDSAKNTVDKYGVDKVDSLKSFSYLRTMSLYYNYVQDFEKSEFYLNQTTKCNLSMSDSVILYYISYELARNKGQIEDALDYLLKYVSLQNNDLRKILMEPAVGAQYDCYRTAAELELIKNRNKITILIASIIIITLIVFSILIIGRNKRRETEKEIRDYISTINDLTTQISINQDKISILNAQVRDMLRQQFTSSDYLYTRYYEQIDDNRKAEHLYRVVKNQIDQFTGSKSIGRIDELLNTTFDGIMERVLSSGLELKEKELLLLRFVLAGFSAKSIAAILGDTHINIMQRKKRLLDKIQFLSPDVMERLRNALNAR